MPNSNMKQQRNIKKLFYSFILLPHASDTFATGRGYILASDSVPICLNAVLTIIKKPLF